VVPAGELEDSAEEKTLNVAERVKNYEGGRDMKTYKVSWGGKSSFSGEEIEAEDERTAYKIFLWKHRQTALSTNDKIKVEWGNGNCVYFFKEDHAEVVENLDQSEIEDALQAPQRERERKQQKGERMSEREKQEQLLRMMEDEQKGTAKLTPKAERARENGPDGGSENKNIVELLNLLAAQIKAQGSVSSSSSDQLEKILRRIEAKLSKIHWAVIAVGMMFASIFIITPQCSQM
jgi:hypothetical protein